MSPGLAPAQWGASWPRGQSIRYMIWHLSGGREHLTDQTNASRTLLMDLESGEWANELCDVFAVPKEILPSIRPSSGEFGCTQGLRYLPDGIPIMGVAGDQQASLVGQGCFEAGQAKCTYGTGAFLLAHTGARPVASRRGLITTRAAALGGGPAQYALEGSVFIAGAAVQWFRDGLEAIGSAPEIGAMALAIRPGQRGDLRARPHRAGRAALGARRAGDPLRTDPGHQPGRRGPRHARGSCLSDR